MLGLDKRCKYVQVKSEIPGRIRKAKYMILKDNK